MKLNSELRRETQKPRQTWMKKTCNGIQDLEKTEKKRPDVQGGTNNGIWKEGKQI